MVFVFLIEAGMTYFMYLRANWIPSALIGLGTAVLAVMHRKNPTKLMTILTWSLLLETFIGLRAW